MGMMLCYNQVSKMPLRLLSRPRGLAKTLNSKESFNMSDSITPTQNPEKSGRRKRPEMYLIWLGIKSRCNNANHPKYKDYGLRGIKICERWNESYKAFVSDIGERPSAKHSIDRINNDGNYEPGNCRWALPVQQSNNTRTNRFIEYDGKVQTVSQWARELGIWKTTLKARLDAGTSIQEALTPQKRAMDSVKAAANNRKSNRVIEHDGRSQTLSQWSAEVGINKDTIKERLNRGWTTEQALSQKAVS